VVIIILPTYNEEPSLRSLLQAVRQAMEDNRFDYRVIVVDDGSTDGTAAIADEMKDALPLERIGHAENLRALEGAGERDIIVTMDSDNTHTPGLIAGMVRGIREGNDVMIASRFRPGARSLGVPLYRRLLTRLGSWAFRIAFPTPNVRDFTSGYRAYRAGLLERAFETYGEEFVAESGFACTVDILLKLREIDAVVNEVPLVLRYDFKYSVSKMLVMRTVCDTLRLLVVRRIGG
jgi:dolichol-phosphate mannosyltransferase